MKCKCGELIKPCPARQRLPEWMCRGYVHTETALHACRGKRTGSMAEPIGETPVNESGWDAARDRITEVNEAIRAERERIRQLAIDHEATIMAECDDCQSKHHKHLFAELMTQET